MELTKESIKEIVQMAKDRVEFKVKEENAMDNLNQFERQLRNEESKRLKLIGRVLIRQRVFPERAYRILSEEILNSMEIEDLQNVLDSYNATEEEIILNIK